LKLRKAVLARGYVEAILGFDFTMYFCLAKAGIAPKDINFGLDFYGNGIIVSENFRTQNPEALKQFIAVTARAWQAAAADPVAAVAAPKDHAHQSTRHSKKKTFEPFGTVPA
jgi:NitT/TauT family transport system substrate-binding protein